MNACSEWLEESDVCCDRIEWLWFRAPGEPASWRYGALSWPFPCCGETESDALERMLRGYGSSADAFFLCSWLDSCGRSEEAAYFLRFVLRVLTQ